MKTAEDKSRVRTIRFYRLLLRQCQAMAASTTNSPITSSKQDISKSSFLLQPRVATTSNSLYFRTSPPLATKPLDLFRLFYILVENSGMPVMLPPSYPQAIKRSYSSASFVAASTEQPADVSIDECFCEVTGGELPAFRNQNADDEMRNVLVNACWTTSDQLRSVVREAFQTNYSRIDTPELHKWTIRAIQILQDQEELRKKSSVAVTDRIRTIATCELGRCVGALAKYKKRPSRRFTYKIRIESLTHDHVHLMGRSLSIQGIGENGKPCAKPVIDSKMLNRPCQYASAAKQHLVPGHCAISVSSFFPPDVPSTVLRPAQRFEFVGNVNLQTDKGIVQGCFHMNNVLANSANAGMAALLIGVVIHARLNYQCKLR